MRLEGKIAIVAGGATGIGKAISKRLAEEGAKVAIFGNEKEQTVATANQLKETGYDIIADVVDITQQDQVDESVERIVQKWGSLDILVNSAGICAPANFLDISQEEWNRHIDVNLNGAFLIGQKAARIMAEHKVQGAIVQVSSVNGLAVEAEQAHYNASKGGLNLLTQSMALELAELGIRVNALCPGFVDTRLTRPLIDNPPAIREFLKSIPMNRVGTTEEMADVAVFLCSQESRYITGHCLVVDGGQLIKLS